MKRKVSFVIAAFRAEGTLLRTYDEIKSLFQKEFTHLEYEIIFVDDGSDDAGLKTIESICQQDPKVIGISFSRNFGQIPAVIAGFRHSTGDATLNRAADLQEPIEAVADLIRSWEQGAEVVIGKRESRQDGWISNTLGNWFWTILQKSNPQFPRGSDFFLLGSKARIVFNEIEEANRFFPYDVLWLGFRPSIVPYHRAKRTIGVSQWTIIKKIKMAVDALLHSTYLPIRMISLAGVIISLLGFVLIGFLIVQRVVAGTNIPGWHSLAGIVIGLNGITMLMVGIIGEYVWRIYHETKSRKNYIISKVIGQVIGHEDRANEDRTSRIVERK